MKIDTSDIMRNLDFAKEQLSKYNNSIMCLETKERIEYLLAQPSAIISDSLSDYQMPLLKILQSMRRLCWDDELSNELEQDIRALKDILEKALERINVGGRKLLEQVFNVGAFRSVLEDYKSYLVKGSEQLEAIDKRVVLMALVVPALERVVSYPDVFLFEEKDSCMPISDELSAQSGRSARHNIEHVVSSVGLNKLLSQLNEIIRKIEHRKRQEEKIQSDQRRRLEVAVNDVHNVKREISEIKLKLIALGDLKSETQAARDASTKVESAVSKCQEIRESVEQTLSDVKTQVGGSAVSKHGMEFYETSKSDRKAAWLWFAGFALMAIITVLVVVILFLQACGFVQSVGTDSKDLFSRIQVTALRIIGISLLMTFTLWCGRMYKVMKNSEMVNRHKYLCLKTFAYFAGAATNADVRDSVLKTAVATIFEPVSTGLLSDDKSNDSGSGNITRLASELIEKIPSKS